MSKHKTDGYEIDEHENTLCFKKTGTLFCDYSVLLLTDLKNIWQYCIAKEICNKTQFQILH